ncbi:hypothetical protein [Myxococcus sp. CA039A]|uniref:hypothetical protein n=1 Tax=Myxococcus sp. CA039A TaxID=2741737 RepID=UPI001C2CE76F|nr:hypothetical protein [Myxococcus sp. CA039A]
MQVSGGIRFLPVFGKSGSGKSCAARELATHLPECRVFELPRDAIQSGDTLRRHLELEARSPQQHRLWVAIVDQYEEEVAGQGNIPSQFIEQLSLLDRDKTLGRPILFIWLTTKREFQASLTAATSRNERILLSENFELIGPERSDWPSIIEETFHFHNQDKNLADFQVLQDNLERVSVERPTLGNAIGAVGGMLSATVDGLQDLSIYQVVMLWPVTDGQRITRVGQFTDQRAGYKVDWPAWYRQLNRDDQTQLPVHEYNRARLYFDLRLVPIAAADLYPLCRNLEDENPTLAPSYFIRFKKTHFYNIVTGNWNPNTFSPLRERESERADEARAWYEGVTQNPVGLGRRIAKLLQNCSVQAQHEQDVSSRYATVRADVLVDRPSEPKHKVIVELKAYSAENTMPSSIKDAIRTTLKRHAQFGGFLQRQ